MLSDSERAFLTRQRIGHLATAGRSGVPHLVPVCFAVGVRDLYTAIDEKPKSGRVLKRLQNILENPKAALLVDHYEDDWSRLGWVRVDGTAELLSETLERDEAIGLLRFRYPQYRAMRLTLVIALRIARVRFWGDLTQ
jgi:PPOX class probable F420-dependent enzyme